MEDKKTVTYFYFVEEDVDKIIKKQRRRLSKRKKEIRQEVEEEMLRLVDARIKSFLLYWKRWCGGLEKEGKKKEA